MPRGPSQLAFQDDAVPNSTGNLLNGTIQVTIDEVFPKSDAPSKDRSPLNRQMALAITVPICFLVLLAVLAVVVYCSRSRRSSRQSSPRNAPQSYRNNFADALDEALAQPNRDYGTISRTCLDDHDQQQPATAVRDPTHGSPNQFASTAAELGKVFSFGTRIDSISRRGEESNTSSSTLPHVDRSANSSSDDDFVGSHFSGLEHPFPISAPVKSSRPSRPNDSGRVSPTTPALPPERWYLHHATGNTGRTEEFQASARVASGEDAGCALTHSEQHRLSDIAIAGTEQTTPPLITSRCDSPTAQKLH